MFQTQTFVQVDSSADGIGKLLEVKGSEAEVEYFVSPVGPRLHRARAPITELRTIELSHQTKVFWHDVESSAWRTGRVYGGLVSAQALRTTEDHYHVRFSSRHEAWVPVSQLNVRWAHPIDDPTEYLAGRVTDTAFFFNGRSRIVRNLSAQRAAFGGLTALASSAIELLPHQVATIRRVLADPIERYLLADEVGLGKTIEAGVLVRQHIIDQPREARVLVVVPKHLVSQWKWELATKFFLATPSLVAVVAEDALDEAGSAANTTMLVIDEAHRAALRAFDPDPRERRLYEKLRAMAARIPRVLLLSGTPVLHQEDGFLAMLHLLEPQAYPLEDRESFRRRVRDRQMIAEASADLDDDASFLFVEEAIARLSDLFAEDERLAELSGVVRSVATREVDDEDRIKALRALRGHISETYRLHRRLLRTRREDPRVRDHLPRRQGVRVIEYKDHAREEAFDFLEAWRLGLAEYGNAGTVEECQTWKRLLVVLVESSLSHPRVLVRRIEARLALNSSTVKEPLVGECRLIGSPWAFVGEEELLRERRNLINASLENDLRSLRFAEWLRDRPEISKAVVFVDDKYVADLVATTLKSEFGGNAVVRHDLGGESANKFEERESLRVLVCDASAEEGLNLQRVGAAVVHYDLPLEPQRIEQRIGRVDRIEARGRMRNIVLTAGTPYESEWLKCLTGSVRVFDRSVAPLQYVLLEAAARIREQLINEGPAAIGLETDRMRDSSSGVDAELRRIRAQEALDSVEADPERDEDFFQRLTAADEVAEDEGENAFQAWVVQSLRFVRRSEGRRIRYVHDAHRTRVPLLDLTARFLDVTTRFASCIDRDPRARRSSTELPFRPVTFERAVAEKDSCLELLRVGHPFVEALEALVRADERGVAFAIWRYVPSINGPPQVYFRFDFVIAADIDPARRVVEPLGGSIEALRRRVDDAFPVEYRSVWLDADLHEVRNQRILGALELPYSRNERIDGGCDTNVRGDRWASVDAVVQVGEWGSLCGRARETAEQSLRRDEVRLERACVAMPGQVRENAIAVENALRSRISRLVGPARDAEERMAKFEWDLAEALATGVDSPSVRLDSTGAVFLSERAVGGAMIAPLSRSSATSARKPGGPSRMSRRETHSYCVWKMRFDPTGGEPTR